MTTYTIFGRFLGFCSLGFGLYILHFEIFHAEGITLFGLVIVAVMVFVGISMMSEDGK